ncbi:MAG: glutaredoxin family protein [Archangium sp.]|nr:glutaredoxin family protein [Archangium sp.]
MSRLLFLLLVLAAQQAHAEEVVLFSRTGCPHCVEAHRFLDELVSAQPGLTVSVQEVDRDPAALRRLQALAAERGETVPGVPAMLIGGQLVFGFDRPETTGVRIRALLERQSPPDEVGAAMVCTADAEQCEEGTVDAPIIGKLRASELGMPLFTLLVGLLDGFNPCAMWVLLFLLSLLVNMKSRPRMALVAGTFVLVSGLVYFAFMAAWLNVFLLLGFSRAVQIVLAVVAVVVGGLNVKEFFAFQRGPSLTIPESAKPGIAARVRKILQAEHLAGALVGVVVLAVLVNFVELLCTAGFPAVYTHVLTAQGLPVWKNYAYLGLYNLAYVVDDGLMVTIAVVTLSRRRLQEREGRWLKLISGAVMLALALVLFFKPAWLAALG